jgi:hypothetical protein
LAESLSTSTGVRKHFRGWIPTVSGALSFSVFGETRHPSRAVVANVADDRIRYVAVYQFRDAADVLVPFRSILSPFLFGIDGRIWFAFLAHTEHVTGKHQYHLVGRAFMFTDLTRWKREVRPGLEGFQRHLRNFLFHDHVNLGNYASSQYANITDLCTRTCSFFADVKIRRSGTTDLSFPFPLEVGRGAPVLPSDPVKLSHIVKILASQLFFFLKDIGHRHQHHQETTDQIVLLYEVQGGDDDTWRNNTLFSIYRKVIQIKRDPHISTFSDALGLIAYAESFAKISHDENRDGTQPVYFGKETSDSIKATQARVERQARERQRQLDIFRNTTIAVAGVLFSFMGLLKLSNYASSVKPSPVLTRSLDWILTYPIQFVALLIVLIAGTIELLTFRNADVSPFSVRVVRAFQFLPRWALALIFTALMLVSAYLFWRLLP